MKRLLPLPRCAALSEHVAPPLDYAKVVSLLKQELRALVLIEPR